MLKLLSLLLSFAFSCATWAATTTHFFKQRLNHAEKSDQRTFSQRYHVNFDYMKGKNSPVLYYVCGEASCEENSLKGGIAQFAQSLGAGMIALEHRYYGKSHPFSDLRTENLQYLTVANALMDLATFQKNVMKEGKLTGPWIVIGGSYPGSLSAYYREKFPTLVVGSLASSAPVMAKYNFEEYDQHITEIAGKECAEDMRAYTRQLEEAMVDPVLLNQYRLMFNARYLQDDMDFLFFTADVAAFAIQYGYKDRFCRNLKEQGSMQGLASFANMLYNQWGYDISEFSFTKAKDIQIEENASMRQWFYQTCREMGYFQAAHSNPELSVRSSLINRDFFEKGCRDLFGINYTGIKEFNRKFFFPLLNEDVASNIIFTNGEEDPWLKLSITPGIAQQYNPNLTSIVIKGAAHCDDIGQKNTPELKAARKKIMDHFKSWIRDFYSRR